MKKLFPLLVTLLLISSCEDSIELITTATINETVNVAILQTNGAALNFSEVIVQTANHHLNGVLTGIRDEILHHPVGLEDVSYAQCFLKLKDVVIFADSNVLLNELLGHFGTSGDIEGQFIQLIDDFREVGTQVLRQ